MGIILRSAGLLTIVGLASAIPFNSTGGIAIRHANGAKDGCMTDDGGWTRGGNCSVVTASVPASGIFTLTTPAGPCVITDSRQMECMMGNGYQNFRSKDDLLTVGHLYSGIFHADSVPLGTSEVVLTISGSGPQKVQMVWNGPV